MIRYVANDDPPLQPRAERSAEIAAKLFRAEFGHLIWTTERTVYNWETGASRMHPGLWELAQDKVAMRNLYAATTP